MILPKKIGVSPKIAVFLLVYVMDIAVVKRNRNTRDTSFHDLFDF